MTFGWSVFAYVWLYLIIEVISYSTVELWEAILTVAFFPVFVINCYVIDTRFLEKLYKWLILGDNQAFARDSISQEEENVEKMIEIMKVVRKSNPKASPQEVIGLAETEMLKHVPKSRAFYRLQANSKFLGGGDLIKNHEEGLKQQIANMKPNNADAVIHFEEPETICLENLGTHYVNVICHRLRGTPPTVFHQVCFFSGFNDLLFEVLMQRPTDKQK